MSSKQPKLSLPDALGREMTDKRISVLRHIAHSGSISQAAREVGVSYKAAWQSLDTLTNLAGVPLVERAVGGAGGGGTILTSAGRRLLDAAQQVDLARANVLQQLASAGQADGAAALFPAFSLSVRTSMRNQLPCHVQSLERNGHFVQVRMTLASGAALTASVTAQSAEILGLQPGLPVLALCKATAVQVVARDPDLPSKENYLQGRASRIARGESGDEISVLLDGGLMLVGFAAAGSALRIRSLVSATVDASAVVVALPG